MISDGEGNVSATRVVVLLVTLAILVPYTIISIKTGTMQPFSADQLQILGITLGAKLIQNSQENKPSEPPKTP